MDRPRVKKQARKLEDGIARVSLKPASSGEGFMGEDDDHQRNSQAATFRVVDDQADSAGMTLGPLVDNELALSSDQKRASREQEAAGGTMVSYRRSMRDTLTHSLIINIFIIQQDAPNMQEPERQA